MKKNTGTLLKVLGMACSAVVFGITLLQDHIEDKQIEETISKEVAKQLKASQEE